MTNHLAEVNFFVYGTLKRRECREHMWPRSPLVVEDAWIHGELYDTGSYPALVPGTDKVLGELWTFAASDFEAVARVLDEIEEYRPLDPYNLYNLYNREVVECETASGRRALAQTYIYARLKDLPAFTRLAPSEPHAFTQWRSA